MADISTYLAAILSAVYGEDVRGSIHDAIEIINDVSEVVLSTGTAVSSASSSSTGFYEDSLYLNTNTYELWKCVGTDTWQSLGILKGADGRGIVSITKTSTAGLVDTYTITYDSGSPGTFTVTNGANGADGADGADGSVWYKGTALTGTGTGITGFPGNENDFYLNSSTGMVYTCTATGTVSTATWDYVMTLTGGGGSSVTVVDNLTSTSATDALSANQGRVLNTNKIDNPSTKTTGDVLTYDGSSWKAQAPSGGGGNIVPLPSALLTASQLVLAVNGATSSEDKIISAWGSKTWSNVECIQLETTPTSDYDTIGTWDDDWKTQSPPDRTGWIFHECLKGIIDDPEVEVRVCNSIDGEMAGSLYAIRYDDDYTYNGVRGGCIAVKLNNKLPANTTLYVRLIRTRTQRIPITPIV